MKPVRGYENTKLYKIQNTSYIFLNKLNYAFSACTCDNNAMCESPEECIDCKCLSPGEILHVNSSSVVA